MLLKTEAKCHKCSNELDLRLPDVRIAKLLVVVTFGEILDYIRKAMEETDWKFNMAGHGLCKECQDKGLDIEP